MPDHAARLAGHAAALAFADGTVVGGYMALAGEADPSILMARLAARGRSLAVPRVTGRNAPLVFHRHDAERRTCAQARFEKGRIAAPEPRPIAMLPDTKMARKATLAASAIARGHEQEPGC